MQIFRGTFTFKMGALGNEIGDFGVWGNPMVVTKSKQAGNYTPIFIISCDTLRPDHLLPYGYDLPTSPHLDKFARDAVVFENAYTTQTFTPVAHMSMLTGKYPTSHGLTKNTDVYSHVNVISEIVKKLWLSNSRIYRFFMVVYAITRFFVWYGFILCPESIEEDNKRKDRRSVFEVCEEAKQWIEG
jgi:glucan phosphoethanolaminetransferase (alkaline phosphatase superfamily)